MLILVRYAVYSAGRVTGQYSHLGCWLAVEMVIDGRLRQGKALISRLNLAAHIQRSAAVGRQASRQQPSTPALSSFFATRLQGLMRCIPYVLRIIIIERTHHFCDGR
jgi:hypothetical protein